MDWTRRGGRYHGIILARGEVFTLRFERVHRDQQSALPACDARHRDFTVQLQLAAAPPLARLRDGRAGWQF